MNKVYIVFVLSLLAFTAMSLRVKTNTQQDHGHATDLPEEGSRLQYGGGPYVNDDNYYQSCPKAGVEEARRYVGGETCGDDTLDAMWINTLRCGNWNAYSGREMAWKVLHELQRGRYSMDKVSCAYTFLRSHTNGGHCVIYWTLVSLWDYRGGKTRSQAKELAEEYTGRVIGNFGVTWNDCD